MPAICHRERPSFSCPRLRYLNDQELSLFAERHPASRRLHERALKSLVSGVPMPWMARSAGGFPIYAVQADDARIRDVGDVPPSIC
jgi:glutamate-1-semialdehyde 2,1-aminomutase